MREIQLVLFQVGEALRLMPSQPLHIIKRNTENGRESSFRIAVNSRYLRKEKPYMTLHLASFLSSCDVSKMETVLSKLGVPFAVASVQAMRSARETLWSATLKQVIVISVTRAELGVALAADPAPPAHAPQDFLGNEIFYWYADQDTLQRLKNFVVDIDLLRGSKIVGAV